jgi:hypothetical protein
MKYLKRAAVGSALTLGLLGIATPAQAGTQDDPAAPTCSNHIANTATFAYCTGGTEVAWVQLESQCKIGPTTRWHSDDWKKIEAGQSLTLSGECRFEAVDARTWWRPYAL